MEDGKPKSLLIGNVEDYPTKARAERAVEKLRWKLNADNPQQKFRLVTVAEPIEKFMRDYAPKHCRRLTQKVYRSLFENHISPKWGAQPIQGIRPMAVEQWLGECQHSRQLK